MQRKQTVGRYSSSNLIEEDSSYALHRHTQQDRGLDDNDTNARDFGSYEYRFHGEGTLMMDHDSQLHVGLRGPYAGNLGIDHPRVFPNHTYMPLHQHTSEMNTTFVNPKQFEAIMRLRMKRMNSRKAKVGYMRAHTKLKQTFKYESRSKHAKKRMRASNGKFLKGKVNDETATKSTGDHAFDEQAPEEPCNADETPRERERHSISKLGKREQRYLEEEEEGMQEPPKPIKVKIEEEHFPVPKLEDNDEESEDQLFAAERAAMGLREPLDPEDEPPMPLGRHDSLMERPRNR